MENEVDTETPEYKAAKANAINAMARGMRTLDINKIAARVVSMLIMDEGVVNKWQRTLELVLQAHALALSTSHFIDRITHRKGGTYGVFVGHARVQTDAPLVDYDEVAVYRSEVDGLWWVRRGTEMFDGRFSKAPIVALDPDKPLRFFDIGTGQPVTFVEETDGMVSFVWEGGTTTRFLGRNEFDSRFRPEFDPGEADRAAAGLEAVIKEMMMQQGSANDVRQQARNVIKAYREATENKSNG